MKDNQLSKKDNNNRSGLVEKTRTIVYMHNNDSMSDIPDNNRAIIYIHGYSKNSGGVNVMYELARIINESQGWESFIFDEDGIEIENDVYNNYIDHIDVNDVVIYPEVIAGNPLNARHVVRWILCKPDIFHNGITNTWGYNDLLVLYSSFDPKIQVTDTDIMYCATKMEVPDLPNVQRDKHRGTLRKGDLFHTRVHINRYLDGKELIHYDFDEMIHLLARSISFTSADPYTYWSFFAAMCHTPSIVIPLEQVSKLDWCKSLFIAYYLKHEFESDLDNNIYDIESLAYTRDEILSSQPFGIAYGDDEHEVIWSKTTLYLTKLQLERSRLCGIRTISRFLTRINTKLSTYNDTYNTLKKLTRT